MRCGITIRQRTSNGEQENYVEIGEGDELEITPMSPRSIWMKVTHADGAWTTWDAVYTAIVLLKGKATP